MKQSKTKYKHVLRTIGESRSISVLSVSAAVDKMMLNYKYKITKLFKLQFKMSIFSQKSWFSGGGLNVYVGYYHMYNKLSLPLRLVNLVCFDQNLSCNPEKYVNTSGEEQVAVVLSWAWITGVFATMLLGNLRLPVSVVVIATTC